MKIPRDAELDMLSNHLTVALHLATQAHVDDDVLTRLAEAKRDVDRERAVESNTEDTTAHASH